MNRKSGKVLWDVIIWLIWVHITLEILSYNFLSQLECRLLVGKTKQNKNKTNKKHLDFYSFPGTVISPGRYYNREYPVAMGAHRPSTKLTCCYSAQENCFQSLANYVNYLLNIN